MCITMDKILAKKPADGQTHHFFWNDDEKHGPLQVGVRIPKEQFARAVGRAYIYMLLVRQYVSETSTNIDDQDEERNACSRTFPEQDPTWQAMVKLGTRMGNAFRGVIHAKGSLGLRYLTSATGQLQQTT